MESASGVTEFWPGVELCLTSGDTLRRPRCTIGWRARHEIEALESSRHPAVPLREARLSIRRRRRPPVSGAGSYLICNAELTVRGIPCRGSRSSIRAGASCRATSPVAYSPDFRLFVLSSVLRWAIATVQNASTKLAIRMSVAFAAPIGGCRPMTNVPRAAGRFRTPGASPCRFSSAVAAAVA
jgi:hypothetical protein